MITTAKPCLLIWSSQQSVDFRAIEKMNQRAGVPFSGYGEHPLDLRGLSRFFIGGILEKGADGGQPQVTAPGCDSAALFQVIEKCRNQRRIYRFESQTGRRLMQPLLGESQKQAKRIPIRTDRVGTCLPLIHQTLGKEVLQQWGQRG